MQPLLVSGSLRQRHQRQFQLLIGLIASVGVAVVVQMMLSANAQRRAAQGDAGLVREMHVRFSGVTLGILNYLETHQSAAMDQVKYQGQAASALLKRFKSEASGSSPTLLGRIEDAYNTQREAAIALLGAESDITSAKAAFEKQRAALITVIDEKLVPPRQKGNMWKGSDRLRSAMSLLAAAEGLSLTATDSKSPLAGAAAFRASLALFDEADHAARANADLRTVRRQFEEVDMTAQRAATGETNKRIALERFLSSRDDLNDSLEEYARATGLRSSSSEPAQRRTAGLILGVAALIMVAAAVGWIVRLRPRLEASVSRPLEEMLQCVEAASTGDLSRLPSYWSHDEVGRLSQAIGRLILVLARSENLVYHLAALVEISGDAIISQNLDGIILSWNKGAQQLYGYAAEEARGQSIALLSPADGGAALRDVIGRVRSGEKVAPFESAHQAKNGRLVRAFIKVAAITDSQRHVIGVSFCAQELSAPRVVPQGYSLSESEQRS